MVSCSKSPPPNDATTLSRVCRASAALAYFGLMTDGRRARDGQATLARRIRIVGVPSRCGKVVVFVAVAVVSISCSRRIIVACSSRRRRIVVALSSHRRRIVAVPSSQRRLGVTFLAIKTPPFILENHTPHVFRA